MKDNRHDTADFRRIFLEDIPLIDTRAPVEFEKGAFPCATNLPLMSDEEREQVGTCYKQSGQRAAIALGHELVSGQLKQERVAQWLAFAQAEPQGYLYCFRGGLRSQICQQWLSEAGLDYPRVEGGYKAMRRFLIETIEKSCEQDNFIILAGYTGSAKTRFLNQFSFAVDLEGLAHHRGSAFGRRPAGQPTQINFENALAIDLLKVNERHPGSAILLEDESRLIGRCSLPLMLREAMQRSSVVVLDSDLDERVHHSWENYIVRKSDEWRQVLGEAAGFEAFAEDIRQSLYRIRKRLGGDRYQDLSELMDTAISAHQGGNASAHKPWIHALLSDYYDPMYRWQLRQRQEQIVFRGDSQAVTEWLHAQQSSQTNPGK